MAYAALAALVVVVLVLTVVSVRSRRPAGSCCAPADPSQDLRMRDAFREEPALRRPARRRRS